MAAKTEEKVVTEIKKNIEKKKAVIGTENTIRGLRQGKISKVFVSTSCPDNVREEIARYAKLSGASVVKLRYSNDELGSICRKPFAISIVGVLA